MRVTTTGLDIAKQVFQVHGVDKQGKVVLRRRLRREQVPSFFANLTPCLVGLEACGGAHYWVRRLSAFGHTVRLMASQFVKPYLKSNKNDSNDAEAICEAVSRPQMRFVPAKSVEQQDIQSLHRVPSRLVRLRTQLANQLRGLLMEYGIVLPQHLGRLRRGLPEILENGSNELTAFSRCLFASLYDEFVDLDGKIEAVEEQVRGVYLKLSLFIHHPIMLLEYQRLYKLPESSRPCQRWIQPFINLRQHRARAEVRPRVRIDREYPGNPLWPMLIASLHRRMGHTEKCDSGYREVYKKTAGKKTELEQALRRAARQALQRRHPEEQFAE